MNDRERHPEYQYLDLLGDAFFPKIDKRVWKETSREDKTGNEFNYSFVSYKRI